MNCIHPFPQVCSRFLKNRILENGKAVITGIALKELKSIRPMGDFLRPAVVTDCFATIADLNVVVDNIPFLWESFGEFQEVHSHASFWEVWLYYSIKFMYVKGQFRCFLIVYLW